MPSTVIPDENLILATRAAVASHGVYGTASKTRVHHNTIAKVARGAAVAPSTIRALEVLRKVRKAEDFQIARTISVTQPRKSQSIYSWPLESIREARNDQLLGKFERPARLAEAMRLDDALFTAYQNRIAPQNAVGAILQPGSGTRGGAILKRAKESISTPRSVLAGINGTMANHGVAFGFAKHVIDEAGTFFDMHLTEWPIEFVQWDETRGLFITRTLGGQRAEIHHGDGHWIIFGKHDFEPWKQDACVLPGALIFAAHIDGIKDWAAASRAHGQAKIVGEMPEGVSLQETEPGKLSPEAEYFLNMLIDIVSGEAGAGLRPFGSKTDFVNSTSTAWQVFSELTLNREKAAARVYLGTDGMLGSVGGAPGVDISALFGVATTKIQGDLDAIERGLKTGLYEPWTAINYGDSRLAPRLEYQLPDADAAKRREDTAKSREAFTSAVKEYRALGFVVSQETVNKLAADYGIEAPQLVEKPATTSNDPAPPVDAGQPTA